jgi:hypothetical protein
MGNKSSSQVAPAKEEEYGPKAERKCRDVFFLLIFIAFWVGMVVVASKAFELGNPDRITSPFDSYGNLCGINNVYEGVVPKDLAQDFTNYPFLYWPDPLSPDLELCVQQCPSPSTIISLNISELVCVYDVEPSILKLGQECWPAYDTEPVLQRCVPTFSFNGSSEIIANAKYRDQASQIIGDTVRAWKWIAVSVGLSLVIAWVAIYLLRLFSGVVVWAVIFAVIASCVAITACMYTLAQTMKATLDTQQPDKRLDSDINNQKAVLIISYGLIGIDVLLILAVLFLRKRIQLAVGIIKEAGKAMAAMPSIVAFPVVIFILLLVFWVYWIVVTAFLGSAGVRVYDADGKFQGYQANNTIQYLEIYHFFGLLWTTQFFIAIGQCTIAGAVASWYWVHDKKDVPLFPVLFAFKRTLRYHLGSLAFGSLIIAIVQFIRAILIYLQKRLQGKESRLLKVFLGMLQCCFKCLERFLKFISKKAYVMIAVKGDSFCGSAQRAFQLFIANFIRVDTTNVISGFLLFLLKLFICILSTLIGIVLMSRDPNLTYWIVPAFLILILSYGVASMFTLVYDMTIETILLSFCEDCDRNDGVAKPFFMPDSLRQFIDTSSKHSSSCC